jgi:hypothetical protein
MLYIAADTFVGRMVDARGGEQASSGKVPWLSAEIQAMGITSEAVGILPRPRC